MQKDNNQPRANNKDQTQHANNSSSSNPENENSAQKKVIYPSKGDEDKEKKQDNEAEKTDRKKRGEPVEDKFDKESEKQDTITVSEDYPGPKESAGEDADKPGIEGQEDVDHGES